MRRIPFFILVISFIISGWFLLTYGKESYPFYGDSMGYYMYLPSTFIFQNHKQLDKLPDNMQFRPMIHACYDCMRKDAVLTTKGYIINKYTYGVAVMEMPFFLIAHLYEKITGGNANGYTETYAWLLKISTLFYAIAGLYILYKTLLLFFNETVSQLAITTIFIGTNLFWFTLYQAGMAHVPLFFLYSILTYLSIRTHKEPSSYKFLVAGISAGLITIIRPTDIICILIPLLYNVYSIATLKQKVYFLSNNVKGVMLFILAFVLPLIPQMIYWKVLAGSYLYYSYIGETFNWLNPKIFEGLFSFANGWLIYSPIMIFSMIGILSGRSIKSLALSVCVIFAAYLYINYSWHCYTYINGLGSRPMINIYALLTLLIAAFINKMSHYNVYLKGFVALLFIFFISINVSYSLQQAKGILLSEESNMTYNLHMLFKVKASYEDLVLYDLQEVQPKEKNIKKIATLWCENYEDSTSNHFIKDTTGKSKYVYNIGTEEYHPKNINIKYSKQLFANADWIKCSGKFLCTQPYFYYKHLFTFDISRDTGTVYWKGLRIDNKIGIADDPTLRASFSHVFLNKWGSIYFYIKMPQGLIEGDNIRLDIWNIGKQELIFDNICMELYQNL